MNWFQHAIARVLGLEQRAQVDLSLLQSRGWAAAARGGSWRYGDYAREGYQSNWVVNACLRQLMSAAANIELEIEVNGVKPEEGKLPKPLLPLAALLRRPNPNMAYSEFVQYLMLYLHLGGIAYIRQIGTGTEMFLGQPRGKASPELWLFRPDEVVPVIVQGNPVVEQYRVLSTSQLVPRAEMLALRFPNPLSNSDGLSVLSPVEGQIDASTGSQQWQARLYGKNGVPPGTLAVDGLDSMTPAQADKVKVEFEQRFADAILNGRVFVHGAKSTSYTSLAATFKDLELNASELQRMRAICAVIGVPSLLIGDTEAKTYANYAEARKALYTETVLPLMEHLAGELTHWLCSRYGDGIELCLETDHIDALQEDKNALFARLQGADWYTDDEKRAECGKAPLGGDAALLRAPQPSFTLGARKQAGARERRSAGVVFERSLFPTLEQRAAYVNKLDSARQPWNNIIRKAMAEFWAKQKERAMGMARAAWYNIETRDWNPGDEDELLIEQLTDHYVAMYESFADKAIGMIGKKGDVPGLNSERISELVASDLADRSHLINQTTADDIQALLRQGMADGEGVQQLRDRITGYYDGISDARGENIARTEVARAQSTASIEGWKEADVTHLEWVAAMDDVTRDSHAEADGTVIAMGDMFSIGGDEMPGPGMGADPAENCNCRCSVAPIVD